MQAFDNISQANDSTSVLTNTRLENQRKTRVMASWAERLGWTTAIVERRFNNATRRTEDEPTVALCGFDNALARAALEDAGFALVIEAGLGNGPTAFMNFALHAFPASRKAREIWKTEIEPASPATDIAPAYADMREQGLADDCGIAVLASRAVGVPFVSLTAAAFVIAELLRRLHGGNAFEVVSGSLLDLSSIETVAQTAEAYPGGFARARPAR